MNASLGWFGIVRLGLVQMSLGAMVVLTTSTMNRVMVVELALPAILPGLLVALHYAMQVLRPRLGYGSDLGGRRTPWILGGMAVLAAGATLAAVATAWMDRAPTGAILLAIAAYALIGAGVGAAGTSLLVLLAKRVDAPRRAPAATIVWSMMIAGFAITAVVAGHVLDPYTPARLVAVTSGVVATGLVLTLLALWGLEGRAAAIDDASRARRASAHAQAGATRHAAAPDAAPPPRFREALAQVWDEPAARRFAIFIFVSMLAYGAQDLLLDPFAGAVFGFTPGQSTKLSGLQHAGVLAGMIGVAVVAGTFARTPLGSLRGWTVAGCVGSAIALLVLAFAGFAGPTFPLAPLVFFLGLANGAYAVAAIGSMMTMVADGRARREGVRMGLWGAAQAIAFGLGGVTGTAASDIARALLGTPAVAYGTVFAIEAVLFLVAAVLALRLTQRSRRDAAPAPRADALRTLGVTQ